LEINHDEIVLTNGEIPFKISISNPINVKSVMSTLSLIKEDCMRICSVISNPFYYSFIPIKIKVGSRATPVIAILLDLGIHIVIGIFQVHWFM
jgi:hypothetical protein